MIDDDTDFAAKTAEDDSSDGSKVGHLPEVLRKFFLQQAGRTREEIFGILAREVRGFLKHVDVSGELHRALVGLKMVVKAEVRFVDEGTPASTVHTEFARPPKPTLIGHKRRARRGKPSRGTR